jgi:hypothetical protein
MSALPYESIDRFALTKGRWQENKKSPVGDGLFTAHPLVSSTVASGTRPKFLRLPAARP